jgi:hypothetical protein
VVSTAGSRTALLVIGATLAFVGLLIVAFAYSGEHAKVTYPPECQHMACPYESLLEWSQIYAVGFLWVATGGALLLAWSLLRPARPITSLEGKLLLERIEGPPRKSD